MVGRGGGQDRVVEGREAGTPSYLQLGGLRISYNSRVEAGKAVDAQPRGGGQPRPLPGAWPQKVSFRTKGRRPGS